MVKYHLLKARRAVTKYLWVTFATAVVERARQFDNWASIVRYNALADLHNEHERIGKLRLEAAVAAKEQAATDSLAAVQATIKAGELSVARATSKVEDAKQFLHGTVL